MKTEGRDDMWLLYAALIAVLLLSSMLKGLPVRRPLGGPVGESSSKVCLLAPASTSGGRLVADGAIQRPETSE